MSKMQRITNVLWGLVMIFCGVMLLRSPAEGLVIAAMIMSVSMILTGIRYLFYFFTMARLMVGGRSMLFIGIIVLDFGMFTTTLIDEPKLIIVIYLIAIHAFSGLINFLRAQEERRLNAPHWKLDTFQGLEDILIAGASVCFLYSVRILVLLYCIGLFNSAVIRIISGFRRTEIIYIQ